MDKVDMDKVDMGKVDEDKHKVDKHKVDKHKVDKQAQGGQGQGSGGVNVLELTLEGTSPGTGNFIIKNLLISRHLEILGEVALKTPCISEQIDILRYLQNFGDNNIFKMLR